MVTVQFTKHQAELLLVLFNVNIKTITRMYGVDDMVIEVAGQPQRQEEVIAQLGWMGAKIAEQLRKH